MRTRIFAFAAILIAAGIATNVMARKVPQEFNEQAMEQLLPTTVANVSYQPGTEEGVSYRMDKATYEKLHPYGIVARVFPYKNVRYDTVVIAGGSPDNFHDPTWCLPGQGWTLGTRQETTVVTDQGKTIPVSYFTATSNDGREMTVMYTFRGPGGYHAGITPLTLDMWTHDFFEAKSHTGAFYRFLNMDGKPSLDQVKEFVAKYLDAANETSKGLL